MGGGGVFDGGGGGCFTSPVVNHIFLSMTYEFKHCNGVCNQ